MARHWKILLSPVPFALQSLCKGLLRRAFLIAWAATLFSAGGEGATGAGRDLPELEGRLALLRQEVERHDELYYRLAAPEISDHEYDELKAELLYLESLRPEGSVPSSSEAVGDDRTRGFETHRHGVPMLSLKKAFSAAELRSFHEEVVKSVGLEVNYWIEPKYDGIAVSLTYENGHFIRATTRGNGWEGNDITENVRAMGGFPEVLGGGRETSASIPARVEIRGEIFMPLDRFEELNVLRTAEGEAPFASPRNLAAGSIRLVDKDAVAERGLKLVCYGWGDWQSEGERPETLKGFRELLQQWGLPAVEHTAEAAGLEGVITALKNWESLWGPPLYPSDGLVIKVDSSLFQERLGFGPSAPKWAVAWKFPPARVTTKLLDIQVQIGRTGAATPVAIMETVELAGTSVSRASLFNAGNLATRDIRIGDVVVLERSGDSIPHILGPLLEKRSVESEPYLFPKACPGCGVDWEERDGGFRCGNRTCPERILGALKYFVSGQGMAIRGLGPETVSTLFKHSKIQGPADLYALSVEDLVGLPGIGERSATKLIAGIHESRDAPWSRIINALGLPGIGVERARVLAAAFPDLQSLAYARFEQLEATASQGGPGFSKAMAQEIEAYLQEPMTQDFLYLLIAAGVGPSPISFPVPAEPSGR